MPRGAYQACDKQACLAKGGHAPWPLTGELEILICMRTCELCGTTISTSANLRRHVRIYHVIDSRKPNDPGRIYTGVKGGKPFGQPPRITIIVDSGDEEMVDRPSNSPSENAMTYGGTGSESIGSENENLSESESENINGDNEDEEGRDCIMISTKNEGEEEEFLGFCSDDEDLIPDEDEDESGEMAHVRNGA